MLPGMKEKCILKVYDEQVYFRFKKIKNYAGGY